MTLLTGLLLGSIISSLVGGFVNAGAAFGNREAQQEANETNIALQKEANQLSIDEAQKNRDFQYMMSSTAHQREVADLKLAGLNPILAAGGSGAPVAGTSAAQVNSARVGAETLDLSGFTSMLNSLSNTMLTQALINGRMEPYLDSKGKFFDSMTDKNDFNGQAEMFQILNAMSQNGSLTQNQLQLLTQLKNSILVGSNRRHFSSSRH